MTTEQLAPGQVADFPIGKLLADPDQPRKSFDDAGIAQLAESIGKLGILVPLRIREGLKGKYIIQDGERRYRAAKLAKLKTVPVLVVPAGDDQALRAAQLTINNLREALKPMEIARMLAGLQRDHFQSVNDLAVFIDAQGLPAMTPKAIKDTIALVDLPDWLQAMIDEGQVKISSAVKLQIAMPYPKVLKNVKEHIAREVKWTGRLTERDVTSTINQAFRCESKNLGKTESWYGDDAVHFNPKVICKGCEHLVSVNGEKFCMNLAEFERHNAEAKAAGLLPGGKKPEKAAEPGKDAPAEVAVKEDSRRESLGTKARDYLHAYLVRRISAKHQEHELDLSPELLTWHAMRRPGVNAYYDRRAPAVEKYEAAEAAGRTCLEQFLAAADLDVDQMHATLEVVHELPWRETQVICHHLWGSSIECVWTMDEEFVGLFRKAELLHLVNVHKLAVPEGSKAWDKLKASELKAAILAQADKVRRSGILQDIYSDVAEPHTSHSADRYASAQDDDLDTCHHGVTFDDHCEQCEAEDEAEAV